MNEEAYTASPTIRNLRVKSHDSVPLHYSTSRNSPASSQFISRPIVAHWDGVGIPWRGLLAV
jgi:hypothetical protein